MSEESPCPTAGALLALAWGGGGGASPECLDTLSSGRMDEGTREQLSRPVASMDDAARLATIKALSHQGSYGSNAGSAECGEFVKELEAWEDTDDGREWHEENGEEIASVVMSFLGVAQCEDALDYDYFRDFAGDVMLLNSQVRVGDESFDKTGDYGYGAHPNCDWRRASTTETCSSGSTGLSNAPSRPMWIPGSVP